MLDKYKNLSACVDIGHFVRSGVGPASAIRTLKQRVIEVHVKDLTADNQYARVGEGKINFPGVLAALKEIGFDGFLTLDFQAPNEESRIGDVKRSVTKMRELIAST